MEVLAGEPNLEAEVMQHRARFRLDFSKVHTAPYRSDECSVHFGAQGSV